MDGIYNLEERLCQELEDIGHKPTWDAGDLEVVDILAHAMKNIEKIIEKKEMAEYGSNDSGGYSSRYNSYSMPRNNMYSMNNNYARSGRYNRSGMYNRYSTGGHDVADKLREIMYDIHDENVRNDLQKIISDVTSGQMR